MRKKKKGIHSSGSFSESMFNFQTKQFCFTMLNKNPKQQLRSRCNLRADCLQESFCLAQTLHWLFTGNPSKKNTSNISASSLIPSKMAGYFNDPCKMGGPYQLYIEGITPILKVKFLWVSLGFLHPEISGSGLTLHL